MTAVWRKDTFGSDVVSNAEKLDLNFQIGVFVDFPEDKISVQATCSVGGDLIHLYSCDGETCQDVGELAMWVAETVVHEIEINQKAIDDASTV